MIIINIKDTLYILGIQMGHAVNKPLEQGDILVTIPFQKRQKLP